MKRSLCLLAVAALVLGPRSAGAQTIIGDLNNFDTLNDTGQVCYGFEIEIDDVHSTDITYTYDWNHYGAPKIGEDNTDPLHPKVFVRYESTKDASGQWGANNSYTNMAIPTITPPAGHSCTDPTVNEGCEHFGVGYYGTPTTVKYHWLVSDNAGGLTYFGAPVGVATPKWTYTQPPGQPAQVVAVIPAPVVPIAPDKQFGEPSWVKVIKTTTHNSNPVALQDLISDDGNGDGLADWQNAEPSEVETEWKLLQTNSAGNAAKDELQGLADDMGDGSEIVTRRYEFYRYGADSDPNLPTSIDGENGEAMCDEVESATDLHGHHSLTAVEVAEAGGGSHTVDCSTRIVVGNYIGAQMAGFAAAAPLGLIDHVQGGDSDTPYPPRTVVVGGVPPYTIEISGGSLPPGLTIGDYPDPDGGPALHGILSGTPTAGGDFPFTVTAWDSLNAGQVSQVYSLHVSGGPAQQLDLIVVKAGVGAGTVTGNTIDCGLTCTAHIDAGTSISLTATPAADSVFTGWSGACTGTGNCTFTLNATSTVTATFAKKQWQLSVSKIGTGTGTVSGSGIDCGSGPCSLMLDEGTAVSLSATPTTGSLFTGWGGDCSGAGSCSPAMTANRSVTATFVPSTQQYLLTVGVTGSGSVTSSPKGINCGKQCSKSFTVGTSVTLTAKPAKKHQFLGWTGACANSGTSLTCTLPILKAEFVGATFN